MIVLFEEEKCKHGFYSDVPDTLSDACIDKIKRFFVDINKHTLEKGFIIKKVDCIIERFPQ